MSGRRAARPRANPALAIVSGNPGRGRRSSRARGEPLGSAVYEIVYQHVDDPPKGRARKHVFTRPKAVTLTILDDRRVLLEGDGPIIGWFQ